jgi:hypothetical protein
MRNIDVYREEIDYNKFKFFLHLVNLQDRNLTIGNFMGFYDFTL